MFATVVDAEVTSTYSLINEFRQHFKNEIAIATTATMKRTAKKKTVATVNNRVYIKTDLRVEKGKEKKINEKKINNHTKIFEKMKLKKRQTKQSKAKEEERNQEADRRCDYKQRNN